jgi:hypothetical protein
MPGNPEKGRVLLKQARAWHERHGHSFKKDDTDELQRFRSGTEEVLGAASGSCGSR